MLSDLLNQKGKSSHVRNVASKLEEFPFRFGGASARIRERNLPGVKRAAQLDKGKLPENRMHD